MVDRITERYDDGTYLHANEDWHEHRAEWKAAQVGEMMRRNRLRPSTVADVGCGTAGVIAALSTTMPEVAFHGFEPARDGYELAKSHHADANIQIHHGTLGEGDTFDLILLLDVFEHVEDYLGLLRSLRDHADGFIFHIPLDLSVQSAARPARISRTRAALGHLHYFNRDIALATLSDAGYEVIDDFYTKAGFEGAGRTWKHKVKALPRRVAYRFSPHLAVRWLGGYSLAVYAR